MCLITDRKVYFLCLKKRKGAYMVIEISMKALIAARAIRPAVASGITGFCFWRLKRKLDRRQIAEDTRDEARKKNEVFVIDGVNAAIALGEATARAVQRIPDVECNGDMAAALKYASEVKNRHKDFMTKQGVDALY